MTAGLMFLSCWAPPSTDGADAEAKAGAEPANMGEVKPTTPVAKFTPTGPTADAKELEALATKAPSPDTGFTVEEVQKTVASTSANPEAALTALRQICRTSDGQKKAADANGVEAIVSLTASGKNTVKALQALEAALMLNVPLQDRAAKAGVGGAVVGVLKAAGDPALVIQAASCIGVAAYRSDEAKENFLSAGAVPELVKRMQAQPEDKPINKACCTALYRLAFDEGEIRNKVCSTPGMREVVMKAAENKVSDDAFWFKLQENEIWPDPNAPPKEEEKKEEKKEEEKKD